MAAVPTMAGMAGVAAGLVLVVVVARRVIAVRIAAVVRFVAVVTGPSVRRRRLHATRLYP